MQNEILISSSVVIKFTDKIRDNLHTYFLLSAQTKLFLVKVYTRLCLAQNYSNRPYFHWYTNN